MCEPLVKVDPPQSQQENEVSSEMPELWHLKGVNAQTPVYSSVQYSISIQCLLMLHYTACNSST